MAQVIGWDSETYCFRPGLAAPRMVCLSYDDGSGGKVVLAEEGLHLLRRWLTDPLVHLVAHHAVYDLGVACAMAPDLLPLVFQAIDEGRVHCTLIREMILANARGELKFEWDEELGEMKRSSFSLASLVWKYLGIFVKKGEDTWRMRYPELEHIPIEQWPEDARRYAILDAEYPRRIYELQGHVHGETGQVQAAWGLQLMKSWGVRTDPEAVNKLGEQLERDYEIALADAQSLGVIRPNGVKDTKAIRERVKAWYESHGRKVPLTTYKGKKSPPPPPNIATDREALTDTDDPALHAVAKVTRVEKLRSTYLPILEKGTERPVTPDYNPIIASFRTSCARPNLQNQPR